MTNNHPAAETPEVEVERDMGQTVSQIGSKFFPSKESPPKAEAIVVVEVDETDSNAVPRSPVSSSPKYPLATPRQPLRQTSVTRKSSEASISETPSKRFKGDTTYLNFPFLLDEKTIDYVQNNKVSWSCWLSIFFFFFSFIFLKFIINRFSYKARISMSDAH